MRQNLESMCAKFIIGESLQEESPVFFRRARMIVTEAAACLAIRKRHAQRKTLSAFIPLFAKPSPVQVYLLLLFLQLFCCQCCLFLDNRLKDLEMFVDGYDHLIIWVGPISARLVTMMLAQHPIPHSLHSFQCENNAQSHRQ